MSLRDDLSGGVVLRESDHRYFHSKNAKEYKPVSRVIDLFREPFDTEGQSRRSAEKELRLEGGRFTEAMVDQRQAELKVRWRTKATTSQIRGNEFHKSFENFDKGLQYEARHAPAIHRIHDEIFKGYHHVEPECCISSNIYGVSGTADKPCQRAPGKKGILDIWDYKTNEGGVTLYSPYSKYFINGLGHLEDSKYNGYALQLSLYAVMAMSKGYTIGRLGILSVPDPCSPTGEYFALPVPFMQMEAKYMLETYAKAA